MNEKEDWEKRSFGMLLNWQKTLEHLKEVRNRERILAERSAYIDFFNVMSEAPFDHHYLFLKFSFTESDMDSLEVHHNIDELSEPPQKTGNITTYPFRLITPRKHDWTKTGFDEFQLAHRGSYVRDHKAEFPDLETLAYTLGWTDPVTGQQGMIRLLPKASYIDGTRFHVYPRNVTGIELSRSVPHYLTEDETDGLDKWYEREIKWREGSGGTI